MNFKVSRSVSVIDVEILYRISALVRQQQSWKFVSDNKFLHLEMCVCVCGGGICDCGWLWFFVFVRVCVCWYLCMGFMSVVVCGCVRI